MKSGSSNIYKILSLILVALLIGSLFLNSRSSLIVFLPFLLVLACPISMIFMMRGMGKHKQDGSKKEAEQKTTEEKKL